MDEAYAISTGGYLGFYEPKKDIKADFQGSLRMLRTE